MISSAHAGTSIRSFALSLGMLFGCLLLLASPQSVLGAQNSSSSSCHGLLIAAGNTPPGSVARQRLLAKLYERNCGDDSDNDGLLDFEEVLVYGTVPSNPDSDSDGLLDGDEVKIFGTDPLNADTDADGLVDGIELTIYGTDPLDADTDDDGLLDGEEVQVYGTDPLNDDTDADGLTDGAEILTHFTDPLDDDTDSDSLLDGWEVNGHPNGTPLPDASPRRLDIYVEMDYMVRASAANGLGPNNDVLEGIVEVFANSPVNNPDGSTGIDIHLELDEEVPYDDNLYPYTSEFYALKASYFDSLRAPIYHYMIWANAYSFGSSSGVSYGIPAVDFIVTLGKWNGGAGGTDEQKIGTFIHELGHNLGLKHGGADHVNYKPNYISVMNYSFQVVGISGPGGIVFDYQRFDLPDLDENNLDEDTGLGAGPEWAGYSTKYFCTDTFSRRDAPVVPIDWNCDGFTGGVVPGDVNRDYTLSVLKSQNNWANIVTDGGGPIGAGVSAESLRVSPLLSIEQPLEEELTWEQHVEQVRSLQGEKGSAIE